VLDGKLIPKIGEAVKKGDLLVSGTYIDKHNKVTVLHSQAQITGRYNESISFVQPLLEEENKPTGEVINGKDLSFFGIRIPISFNKKIISEYEYEENIQNLSFFSIKLPLSIVHKTYKLIDKQEISYTKETAEIKINEQIENFEKTFYKDKTIVSKEIVKGETENSISFKINYVIEGEIGTKKLFIAK
ncbi:MAG: sporulation protein YqfD, partial [Oscillospiraceae bacterium]